MKSEFAEEVEKFIRSDAGRALASDLLKVEDTLGANKIIERAMVAGGIANNEAMLVISHKLANTMLLCINHGGKGFVSDCNICKGI